MEYLPGDEFTQSIRDEAYEVWKSVVEDDNVSMLIPKLQIIEQESPCPLGWGRIASTNIFKTM